jgi:hypothetical protein
MTVPRDWSQDITTARILPHGGLTHQQTPLPPVAPVISSDTSAFLASNIGMPHRSTEFNHEKTREAYYTNTSVSRQ